MIIIQPPPKEEFAETLRSIGRKKAAEIYNVSLGTIALWIKGYGIKLRAGRPLITPPPRAELLELVEKRVPYREIADKYGVSNFTICGWVADYNITPRWGMDGWPEKSALQEDIKDMTVAEVADKYGYSYRRMLDIIHELDVINPRSRKRRREEATWSAEGL